MALLAQSPVFPLAQPPILPPFSQSHSIQGKNFTLTFGVSHELATFETITPPRASPEATSQSSADSGPLEAKKPIEDCTVCAFGAPVLFL